MKKWYVICLIGCASAFLYFVFSFSQLSEQLQRDRIAFSQQLQSLIDQQQWIVSELPGRTMLPGTKRLEIVRDGDVQTGVRVRFMPSEQFVDEQLYVSIGQLPPKVNEWSPLDAPYSDEVKVYPMRRTASDFEAVVPQVVFADASARFFYWISSERTNGDVAETMRETMPSMYTSGSIAFSTFVQGNLNESGSFYLIYDEERENESPYLPFTVTLYFVDEETGE
ncbi:MAG: hypothetical protein ACRC5C_10620, partial [Bacilli bacterium]